MAADVTDPALMSGLLVAVSVMAMGCAAMLAIAIYTMRDRASTDGLLLLAFLALCAIALAVGAFAARRVFEEQRQLLNDALIRVEEYAAEPEPDEPFSGAVVQTTNPRLYLRSNVMTDRQLREFAVAIWTNRAGEGGEWQGGDKLSRRMVKAFLTNYTENFGRLVEEMREWGWIDGPAKEWTDDGREALWKLSPYSDEAADGA